MSTSTTAMRTSTSATNTPQFWERLWRTAGVQSVGLFSVAYFVYGTQPNVGASAEALVAFYQGDRMRILLATVLSGFAVLNLMWFAAALRTTLADAGRDGWVPQQRPPARRSGDFFCCSSRSTPSLRTQSQAREVRHFWGGSTTWCGPESC
jgi:hypothetical protein